MSMQVERSAAEAAYVSAIDTAAGALPSAEWLAPARSSAQSSLSEHGLPHRRLESWRWTDLRTMIDGPFPPNIESPANEISASLERPFAACETHTAVFVDGHFNSGLSNLASLDERLELVILGDRLADAPAWLRKQFGNSYGPDDDPVMTLNTAFFADGIGLRVPDGVKLERPLELVFFNSGEVPQTISTRVAITVGKGAELTVIESHSGGAGKSYVSNSVLELSVADGARLHHVKLQDESTDAVHLGNVRVTIGASAEYRNFALNIGARVSRNQFFAKLAGEGSNLDAAAAYLLCGRQHCDTALQVDHAVANCTSNELFKCVMDDTARGIFQGKIIVRPQAQKTDGMQMSQGLLLSEHAEFDAKPELEIFADDVRCTHGATSGDLDDDLMFYLRSRGIPEAEAKSLLIAAFVGEAIGQVEDENLRDVLNGIAHGWVGRQG